MDWIAIFKVLKIIFSALPWILSVGALHQFLYNKYPKYYFFGSKDSRSGEIQSGN